MIIAALIGSVVIVAVAIGFVTIGVLVTGSYEDRFPLKHVLRTNFADVNAVATAQLEGRTAVVSGSDDGTVRVWDLATGDPIGQPLTGHTGAVTAVVTSRLEGRTVIASGGEDDTIWVWDPASGDPVGEPISTRIELPAQPRGVVALATTELDARPVVIVNHRSGGVSVWDLATREPIHDRAIVPACTPTSVATAQQDGRPVIVVGNRCGGAGCGGGIQLPASRSAYPSAAAPPAMCSR